MARFLHPGELNPYTQFAQACKILRSTTRAANSAWYKDALSLDSQIHLRIDGLQISSYYYDRIDNRWSAGPTLTEDILRDSTKVQFFAAELLRQSRSLGFKSLGIILHVADEFSTAELKPEFDNPADLNELREAAYTDPASVVADSSIQVDLASWRVIPYPAAGGEIIGTATTISRQHAEFLAILRKAGEVANFPIITLALCDPLIAVLGMSGWVKPSQGKPFVGILQYPWFITLAFFNEHADLKLIRTIQHRGLRRPTNFRNSLITTAASLEFVDPDLFILPMGELVDTTLNADLKLSFSTCRVEVINPATPEGIPSYHPELPVSVEADLQENAIDSHTFTTFREERWATQDFLPASKEEQEIYPKYAEIRLLKYFRVAHVALFLLGVASLLYFGVRAIAIVNKPEWAFDPVQAQQSAARVSSFSAEKQKSDQWERLLEDRSKAWTAMESFARLFPPQGGLLARTYEHTAKPESVAASATAGFTKEWKISGFAREEALERINKLNSQEGITAHYKEVATITGNSAYAPDLPSRSIIVNVGTSENPSYNPSSDPQMASDETSYPFLFELVISQRFESTDPMALPTTKAP